MIVTELAGINWLATLVAALVAFALGAVWYAVLFGDIWLKVHAISPERAREMGQRPARTFSIMLAGLFLIASLLSLLAQGLGVSGLAGGTLLGLTLWIGAAAPLNLIDNTAQEKSLGTFLVDGSYQLVYLLLMGAIIGVWR